jgi:putative addiction module component (TIGR02574 family)
MNAIARKLLDGALELPPSERADLAASLLESLDDGDDADATAAWDVEIAKRIAELESGQVKAIPWAEARRMILSDDASEP